MPKKEVQPEAVEDVPEDAPVIKELKVLDDKYLEMERACDKEIKEIQKKYMEQQKPLLDQRAEVLAKEGENTDTTGTPAQKGFWVTAMQNHPALEEFIQKWDLPVLEYLKDITTAPLDVNEMDKGFKIAFHFAKNPYFEAEVLEKEYHTEEDSPYTQELTVTQIKATDIEWKEGKDITVEKVAKKVKGGGAKKAKQKKEKEEPRESFFRDFFRSLKPGEAVPDDLNLEDMLDSDDEENDDEIMEMLMDRDHEIGTAIQEQLIPFAVRWFTGEAAPEGDDEDDDEDSEEEDSEDDDDDEDVPAPKKKGGKQPVGKAGKEGKDKDQKQTEECKQQ